jgi:hypothetical protein
VVATFTLRVAPRPGVHRMRFSAITSQSVDGDWLWVQSPALTIEVQGP